jgi:hypothetical protein
LEAGRPLGQVRLQRALQVLVDLGAEKMFNRYFYFQDVFVFKILLHILLK